MKKDSLTWFDCTVTYAKTVEDGTMKNVKEAYLVEAVTFSDAEKRITEEMTPFISGEFEVAAVKKIRINEIFGDGSDKWYRCKVMFITLDEKTGAEKKTAGTMFINAGDFEQSVEVLKEGMKGTMSDWEIASISETAYLELYHAKG